MFDLKSPHSAMGKRNYQKVQKYRRKRARLLEVGELFGDASLNVPLVPTEQICVPVSPSNTTSSSPGKGQDIIESQQQAVSRTTYGETTLEQNDTTMEKQGDDRSEMDVLVDDDDDNNERADNMTDAFHAGDNVHLGMDLLTVCTETKVPLETYDRILRIFKKYCPGHTDPKWWNTIPTREKLLKILKSKVPTVNPTLHQVTNDSRGKSRL